MIRYLAIDGNYFANRCIFTLNQGDNVNNLETDLECQRFYEALRVQLAKIWDVFGKHCDNIIFVSDSYSWRNKLEPYKPYYVKLQESEEEGTEINITYKGLRKEIKEQSDINYENFYKYYDMFVDSIYDKIPVFKVDGLEGDDLFALIADHINADSDECCIFGTDKDLTQLVTGGVYMFLNTRSKENPNGLFMISKEISNIYIPEKPDPLKMLMARHTDDITFKNLLSADLYDKNGTVDRLWGNGLKLSEPHKIILNKIVCGDKSDNILPLFRWKSGDRNYSVTEKMIEKAFFNMMEGYNDGTCKMVLNDFDSLVDFLSNLMIITRQKCAMYLIREHFAYNRQIVELKRKYMPVESVEKFENRFKELQPKMNKMLGYQYIREALSLASAQINDQATNILKDSIPVDF